MTRNELNHLKVDAYKGFVQLHYGKDVYDRLELAIRNNINADDFEARSKDFDKKLDRIDLDEE